MITFSFSYWQLALIILLIFSIGFYSGIKYSGKAVRWAMKHGRLYALTDKRGWLPKHPTQHKLGDER